MDIRRYKSSYKTFKSYEAKIKFSLQNKNDIIFLINKNDYILRKE